MKRLPKIWLLLILGFIFFFFWAQTIPITDPTESNYALTAKEMVRSGDWISPRIYGKVWYDKPIMIYWLLALAMKGLGYSDGVLRLVPALAGALGLALIYWFVARLKGERAGIVAALLLGTTLQYFIIAKLIITDMVLFFLDSAALAFFYFGYTNQNQTKRWYLPMYICLGLAVLTKGPVGVLLPGLIVLVFLTCRKQWVEMRRMKIGSGILLFALAAAPWYLVMYLKHGKDFVDTFLGVHNYLRATVSEHPKYNVWYYYPVLFLASTLPWTGIVIGGIRDGIRKIRQQDELSLFLMIWTGVVFIFYSLMATKYPTYTFPILFPLFVLTAGYLETAWEANKGPASWALLGPLTFWLLLLGGIAFKYLKGPALLIFMVAGVFSFGLVFWDRLGGKKTRSGVVSFYGVLLSYLLFAGMLAPGLINSHNSGKQLAKALAPYGGYQIGTYQFYSTSAVYYSDHLLIALKPQASIANYRNKSFSWYAKYTMPIKTVREFASPSPASKLIVVPVKSQTEFLHEATGIPLEKIAQKEDRIFYRVQASVH